MTVRRALSIALRTLGVVALLGLALGIFYWRPLVTRLLDESQPKIQKALSEALGVPVEMGKIHVQWDWLFPEIVIDRVETELYRMKASRFLMRLDVRESFQQRQIRIGKIRVEDFAGTYDEAEKVLQLAPVAGPSGTLAVGLATLFEVEWVRPHILIKLKGKAPWRIETERWITRARWEEGNELGVRFEVDQLSADIPTFWPQKVQWSQMKAAVKIAGSLHKVERIDFDIQSWKWKKLDLKIRGKWAPLDGFSEGTVTGQSGDLSSYMEALPKSWIKPDVAVWLENHVQEAKMERPTARFRLQKGVLEDLDVSSKMTIPRLEYAEGWPPIEQARGTFLLGIAKDSANPKIQVGIDEATLLQQKFHETQLEIGDPEQGVQVSMKLAMDAKDLVHFFEATPLKASIDPLFAELEFSGPTQFSLSLKIPLEDEPSVSGRVDLEQAAVRLKRADVLWSNTRGGIAWDEKRVKLVDMQSKWNGSAVHWNGVVEMASGKADIAVRGKLAVEEGERIARVLLGKDVDVRRYVTGEIPFQSKWTLQPARDDRPPEMSFALESSLSGLGIQLPEPVAKSPKEEWPTKIEGQTVGEAWTRFQLKTSGPGSVEKGDIQYKWQNAGQPRQLISARVGAVEMESWSSWASKEFTGDASTTKPPATTIDLQLERLKWLNVSLPSLRLQSLWTPDGDQMKTSTKIQSADLEGVVDVPWPAQGQTLVARFSKVVLAEIPKKPPPANPVASPSSEPVTPVSYSAWPSLNINVARLRIGPQLFGALDAVIEKRSDAFQVTRFQSKSPELEVRLERGRVDVEPSGFARTSALSGDLLVTQTLFPTRFEKLKGVELSSSKIYFDVQWPGGPEAFSLKNLSGKVSGQLKSGILRGVESSAATVFNFLSYSTDDSDQKILRFYKGTLDLRMKDGVVTLNPFKALFGSVFAKVTGKADAVHETLDMEARVTPLVEDVHDEDPGNLLSHTYVVDGTWAKPSVRLKIF